jgi:hypothetical protein
MYVSNLPVLGIHDSYKDARNHKLVKADTKTL